MRIPGTALQLPISVPTRAPLRVIEGGRSMAPSPAAARTLPTGSVAGKDSQHPFTDLTLGGIDINPELSGHLKYVVYEEMRKSDPAIKSCLWLYKLPIRQATWTVDPWSDAPEDLLVADAVAWQFGLDEHEGQLDLSWDEWLQQSLLMFDFGAMFEEVAWGDPQLWTPRGDDGTNSRIIRPIARFAPRFPSTINDIEHDQATGGIKRMRQLLPGAEWMPGEQLAYYVLEREGTNWFGTSLLRAMYGPWRLKKALMIATAIGWDRFSSGVPVVRYPQGGGPNAKREAETAARNYRTHERAWLVFEGPKEKGWDIEIVDGTKTLADATPLLQFYDEQISVAGLQQFSQLGRTTHGSRAVGEVLVDPFYQAISAHAEYFRAQRQRLAIRRFVDVNFGTDYMAPTLRVGKIQSKSVLMVAQAIEAFSAAGMNFTDRATQNDIRDMLDLATLPEDAQEALDAMPGLGIEQTVPPPEGAPVTV